MTRGHALGWAALVALTLGAGSAALAPAGRAEPAPRLGEAEVLELDLAFFRARVARDPQGARDHAELARLYLQRARLGGGADADLARAEVHARRSLALRQARNPEALQVLASSLMGRHGFAEARDVAERLVARDSSPAMRAMLGEIQLELGEYEEAARTFGALFTLRTGLTVAPRYARWEEVRGHPAEARRLLRAAQREAAGRHAVPASQLVWFHWRLADLALRAGRLDEAERELRAGLRLAAEDHRLLDGLARVALARGRWDDAVALGERAILGWPDPGTLALLVAGHAALGDSLRSADYERALSVAVAAQSGAVHRTWDLFLLDRGREVRRVLARARQDLRTRRDVYGWDLLAWALYRSGDLDAALEAADQALALGTRDASLHFHAGMIAARAGRTGLAVGRLEKALAINPRWHPTQPDEARATLRRLADARARRE